MSEDSARERKLGRVSSLFKFINKFLRREIIEKFIGATTTPNEPIINNQLEEG